MPILGRQRQEDLKFEARKGKGSSETLSQKNKLGIVVHDSKSNYLGKKLSGPQNS
jgi:hypothetical protein